MSDYINFKKQRNFVSKMYKKEKRKFYKNKIIAIIGTRDCNTRC